MSGAKPNPHFRVESPFTVSQVHLVSPTYRLLSWDRRAVSESMDDDSAYASITKANYSLFT